MREKAEELLTELPNCPYGMLRPVKRLIVIVMVMIDVEGGRCMRGNDGKLCFREKEVKSGRIMN